MSGFIVSKKAEIDLVNIAIYTQNMWGKLQRNAYITEINKNLIEVVRVLHDRMDIEMNLSNVIQ